MPSGNKGQRPSRPEWNDWLEDDVLRMVGGQLMNDQFLSAALMFSVAFASGCSSPQIDVEAERQALLATDANCAAAASTNDMEHLWNFWSEDALMLLSADRSLVGREEIKQLTIRSREDSNFTISWKAVGADVSADATMGYTYGNGTITRTEVDGEVATQTTPYLTVWKKQPDGSWKVVIEK